VQSWEQIGSTEAISGTYTSGYYSNCILGTIMQDGVWLGIFSAVEGYRMLKVFGVQFPKIGWGPDCHGNQL
jgi:hypothetical protein